MSSGNVISFFPRRWSGEVQPAGKLHPECASLGVQAPLSGGDGMNFFPLCKRMSSLVARG